MRGWYPWVFIIGALALSARSFAAPVGATAAIDRSVGRVDDAILWDSELAPQLINKDAADRPAILEQMIDDELMLADGKRQRITVDKAEVMAALADIKRDNNLDDAQLDSILQQQGYTRAHYLVALEKQIMILRVKNQVVSPRVSVSDAEIALEGKARKLPAPLSGKDLETVRRDLRKKAMDAETISYLADLKRHAWIERRQLPSEKPSAKPVKPSDLTGVIKKVTVKGVDAKLVLADFATVKDKPLDVEQLRGLAAGVFAKPGILDITLRGVQLANGSELVIEVVPQPVLRKLSAVETGNTPIALTMPLPASGVPLDAKRVNEISQTLWYNYRASGHLDVAVAWRRVPVANGTDVVIEVTPGVASTVNTIGFTGNTLPAGELTKVAARWLIIGDPVLAENLRLATTWLENYYQDRGFVLAKVKSLKPTGGKAAIVFQLEEGPQFRYGMITIKGVPAPEHAKYLTLFGLKPGAVFSRSDISAGSKRITDSFKAAGKQYSYVTPLTNVDIDKKTIALTLEISPGN